MSHPWAVRMAGAGAPAAAELRLERGVDVCEADDALWLRGDVCDERLDLLLRRLPGALRYEVLSDGQLRPEGKRLPSGRLPNGPWTAIGKWAVVDLPIATLAARATSRIPYRLERVATSQEPSLIVTTLNIWEAYGAIAPELRLDRLIFAVSSDERVIVRGVPLPPIGGERYYEQSGLAIPCGWGWPSWLTAEVVRDALEIETADLALISPSGAWQVIQRDQFVRATRSAIRLSAQAERE